MCCSLSTAGVLWSLLSLLSAIAAGTGFYLPYWIKGSLVGHEAFLGPFRRCNYPRLGRDNNTVEIVLECGRYTTFADIPSLYWQLTTILVGVGTAISLLVAFTAFSGCCMSDVITKGSARALGSIQLFSAFLIVVGSALYGFGLGAREVKDVCGNSGIFLLGNCHLYWSVYCIAGASFGLFVCFLLSFWATKSKSSRRSPSGTL